MAEINRDAVRAPGPDDLLMVTFTIEGKTAAWAVRTMSFRGLFAEPTKKLGDPEQKVITVPARGDDEFRLEGRIIGANFLTGIDRRLDVQRRSIERLLEHLKVHCPKLNHNGECEFIG